jgi:hypothetical protein
LEKKNDHKAILGLKIESWSILDASSSAQTLKCREIGRFGFSDSSSLGTRLIGRDRIIGIGTVVPLEEAKKGHLWEYNRYISLGRDIASCYTREIE